MKNISFLSENFQFLEVKFSIYLNRQCFHNAYLGHYCLLNKSLDTAEYIGV